MPPILDNLNSLRLLAQFCVVHVHLADNFGHQYGWLPDTFVEDVASFVFVPSGFVMAFSHAMENKEEPRDREEYLGMGTMLPTFLLSCPLDLPGAAIMQYRAGCSLFWPACALQLFLLSPWTGI